jgi:hypothetical protein
VKKVEENPTKRIEKNPTTRVAQTPYNECSTMQIQNKEERKGLSYRERKRRGVTLDGSFRNSAPKKKKKKKGLASG